ncbi:hypothetical protein COU58_00430 [Candidatus Pacearchaeota archaeon CG10_big_fil_rev_8_21_14_0_10_32_42]|nr:MAG: hypothetical protein COU58_00430 [Candidatus Pacearchaeota archaeon CG10_big_fil_rev_8_21_14_0_10_32_42]
MKLEEINDWNEVRTFLKKNFKNPWKKYQELAQYQQEIASTKYPNLTPLQTWNKSFENMKLYLKKQIKEKCKTG